MKLLQELTKGFQDLSYNPLSMKIKVGVIFGGRSGEHEVSLVSASSVIKELPKKKFTVKEIGISKDGVWYAGKGVMEKFKSGDLSGMKPVSFEKALKGCSIAFPVLHGPFGEDGTIQGLFEMMKIPYVGCGVLSSSVCMDKVSTKSILENSGIRIVPFVSFSRSDFETDSEAIISRIEKDIEFPCFVKPSNMGSSVGITKVKALDALRMAIDIALGYDSKVLVEKAVNGREIECAVLGNGTPRAGELGEVIVGGEFYDFYDKYVDGKSHTEIPAQNLDPSKRIEIQEICLRTYKALDCSGLARVDCFLDRDTGAVYLNEVNTMPGFTSISMYPKMLDAAGVRYPELLTALIDLGFERFKERSMNKTSFESGSDWFKKS